MFQILIFLVFSSNVYSSALDWLIENQNTPNIHHSVESISNLSDLFTNLNSSKENIEALLEIIRIYAHKNTPAPQELVKSIVEMGFPETDVIEALKITRNNKAAAVRKKKHSPRLD